jgi:hypothetical protein
MERLILKTSDINHEDAIRIIANAQAYLDEMDAVDPDKVNAEKNELRRTLVEVQKTVISSEVYQRYIVDLDQ